MKRTIVSLLMICGLYGQDVEYKMPEIIWIDADCDTCVDDSYYINPDSSWTVSFISNEVYQKFIITTFFNLYEQYEIECYNDSTLEYFEVFGFGDNKYRIKGHSLDPGFDPNYRYGEEIWTHKDPIFQGFMEWLKEQK